VNTTQRTSYRKSSAVRAAKGDKVDMITTAKIEDGLASLAHALKVLVYNECPRYFELLDINNDGIFLEPLLFAWFNNPNAPGRPPLEQLLFGYIDPAARPLQVPVLPDGNNTIFIPRIGHLKLSGENRDRQLTLEPSGNDLHILDDDGSVIPHRYFPVIDVEGFEVIDHASPLLLPYFAQAYPDSANGFYNIDFTHIAHRHLETLKRALQIIKKYSPVYYKQTRLTTRRMMLYEYFPVNSFATKTFHGCIFMCTRPDSSIAFFLDDLVHQCSHNLLNTFITDTSVYFKIDPELDMLGAYIKNEKELRTVYSAFHGLFTVAQRAIFFGKIYEAPGLFSEPERHELLARYCDQFRRFKSGLERADPGLLYTRKGKLLYDQVERCAHEALSKISSIIRDSDFSNQVSRFDYQKFCVLNPIQKFRDLHYL
jgi:hypothetical protein